MMKKLDPKAVWLFFIQYSLGFIFLAVFFTVCFIPTFLSELINNSFFNTSVLLICGAFLLGMIVLLALCYVFAKLTYDNYLYELKEDGFYKESGVITKKYVTIPYERIQNIDIYRGVLARLLGLSDLQIQTAGMSAVYTRNSVQSVGVEGRLPALSMQEAMLIRDELVKRSKNHKQGL